MPTLVLIRHGESDWNKQNRFTGWVDIDLSDSGKQEALEAGAALKERGYDFDVVFTSVLKRAIKTMWTILDHLDQVWLPVIKSWRLNERMYGALQGLNKMEVLAEHGQENVDIWRRSYSIPPPEISEDHEYYPGKDRRYAQLEKVPLTESLMLTSERLLPFWHSDIVPRLKNAERVLIVAHGNSIRAIVKYLDQVSDEAISKLNIPTGVPLVYELEDGSLKPIKHYYLADPDVIAKKEQAVLMQARAKGFSGLKTPLIQIPMLRQSDATSPECSINSVVLPQIMGSLMAANLQARMQRDAQKRFVLRGNGAIKAMSFDSMDHQYLLVGCMFGFAVYDAFPLLQRKMAATLRPRFRVYHGQSDEAHIGTVCGVSWYPPDPALFATCGSDGRLCFWDLGHESLVTETIPAGFRNENRSLLAIQWSSANPNVLVTLSQNHLNIIDVRTGCSEQELQPASPLLSAVLFDPSDSNCIYAANENGVISALDARSPLHRRIVFTDVGSCVAPPPNSPLHLDPAAHTAAVWQLGIPEHRRRLVSIDRNFRCQQWDLNTGHAVKGLVPPQIGPLLGSERDSNTPSITCNERFAIISHKHSIAIWDPYMGTTLNTIHCEDRTTDTVTWVPEQAAFLSGSRDGQITLYANAPKDINEAERIGRRPKRPSPPSHLSPPSQRYPSLPRVLRPLT